MGTDLAKQLKQHRFFAGLKAKDIAKLAACGSVQSISAGHQIAAEGDPADEFYVLLDGRVAIETHVPGKPAITLQSIEAGDVIGWSWINGQDWVFDVRTLTDCKIGALNACKVVDLMSQDCGLGFELMRRINRVIAERLSATRLQLLDIYGQGADDD